MSAPIKMDGYRILNIDYRANVKAEEFSDPENSGFEQKQEFSISDDFKFGLIKLIYKCYDVGKKRIVTVTVQGQFSFDFTSKYYSQNSVKELLAINGSAILFPYVRSIISMITTLDSPDAIVLPTVNFVEEADDKNDTNVNKG